MKKRKISGSSAVLSQLLLVLFFTPLIIMLFYLVFYKHFTVEGLIFLVFILSVLLIFVWKKFKYADIYIEGEKVIIKKLFKNNKKDINALKKIDESILPFSFILKFDDGSYYKFTLNHSDIIRNIKGRAKASNEILNQLKKEFSIKEHPANK